MAAEDGEDGGVEGAEIGDAHAAFDGFDAAHAGDDGGDGGVGDAEAEGDFGERAGDGGEIGAEGGDALDDLLLAVAAEIFGAEFGGIEDGVFGDGSGEAAFIEGDAGEDADVEIAAEGEEVFLRALIEDVIDDLHGVDEAGADDAQGGIGLMIVDGDTDSADFPGCFQIFKGAAPFVAIEPIGIPDVQLLEVDGFEAEVAEAGFGGADDVVVGEDVGDADARLGGPEHVFGRDFGGDVNFAGCVADDLADEAFAMAVAIGERGVDEIQAEFEGAADGAEGFLVGAALPLIAADAPGTIADFAHLPIGSSERA